MAKENNDQLDEVAEEIEPAKGKKSKTHKPKAEGPSMIVMIGGALGAVVLIIASVVIGTIIANKLFPPIQPLVTESNIETTHNENSGDKNKEKLPPMPDEEGEDDVISLLADNEWLTLTTARMQTNLASPQSTVCLIELAISYKPYYVTQLTERGFLTPAGEDSDGNPVAGTADTSNALYKKLNQMISSKMLEYISSHDQMTLQQLQSSAKLSDTLKNILKPIFRGTGLTIGKIDIPYFMFART